MNKKFDHYKDSVYKWFNNNISTLNDADLQKFVNDAMHGKLTFQCADEINTDDSDISMIDHLLMDIASEKNDELINTYTDEIDWDNDYVEKYNNEVIMDKKLEARISRLERMVDHKSVKNESVDPVAEAIYRASNDIQQIVKDLCKTLAYSNIVDHSEVDNALSLCEDSFSEEANYRLKSIFKNRDLK